MVQKTTEQYREYVENLSSFMVKQRGRFWYVYSGFACLPKPLRGEFTSYHAAMNVVKDFQAGVRQKAKANAEMQLNRAKRRRFQKDNLSATSHTTTAN